MLRPDALMVLFTRRVSWLSRSWTGRLPNKPARIVDAGAGSGRFLAEVLRREPGVEAVAVDSDPMATLMTRAMLAVSKASKVRVIQGDYTKLKLPEMNCRTAFYWQFALRPPPSVERRIQGLGANDC